MPYSFEHRNQYFQGYSKLPKWNFYFELGTWGEYKFVGLDFDTYCNSSLVTGQGEDRGSKKKWGEDRDFPVC